MTLRKRTNGRTVCKECPTRTELSPDELIAGVLGLPVLHRLVNHDPGCSGGCTCDRQMTELVSVDAVLALLRGE